LRHYGELMGPFVEEMLRDIEAAVADTDAVVCSPLTFQAFDFAERHGKPCAMASPVPITPTGAFPFMVMPPAVWEWLPLVPGWLAKPGNWLTHQVALHAISLGTWRQLNRWRLSQGLRPAWGGALGLTRQHRLRVVYGISPRVLPRPLDWGPNVALTGAWTLGPPAGWAPSAALEAFMAGEPPVYVGFGSMIGADPDRLTREVVEALRLAGRRGVLLGGWQDLGRGALPDHVLRVDDVPHEWLFPRCVAVVHHGGAGTTAAALRAGVPQVVCPYFADQPFWAARVAALGVGPRAVPQGELTAARLAGGITAALGDQVVRDRAAALGAQLRAEDGVALACEQLERWLG
jgi:sterol 3beta-glucosyltransferase